MKNKILLLIAVATLGLKTATMAQVPSYVPTNGLVGYWPFNGNANDESVNGNNGTANGATLTTDRNGNANKAYSFDGLNDYIEVPHSNSISITGDITISAWIKTNGPNGLNYQPVVSRRETYWSSEYTMGYSYHTNIVHDTKLIAGRGLGMGIGEQDWSSSSYSVNNWENWIVTINNNQMKIYKNGVLDNTQAFSLVPANQVCPLLFGKNTLADITNSEQFYGNIDDIGIWNRALTQQEITDLYNGCQLSVSTQPSNQTININNTAQFIVGSSDTNATYQWQTNLGLGFQNLNNAGQYNGTTNDTLSVANVAMNNDNQQFRCIINSGLCADTSNVAVLSVNNNVGIHETAQHKLFSVFPNPAHNIINVKADHKLIGSVFTIYDNTGKAVQSGKINAANTSIELINLSSGIYLFSVGNHVKQPFKVIKE
jgi:hypothetical protein